MNDNDLKTLLASEISAADLHDSNELAESRTRAMEYYRGEMRDTLIKQAESAGVKTSENFYPELPDAVMAQMAEQAANPAKTNPQLAQAAQQHADNMALRLKEIDVTAQLKREEISAELALKRDFMTSNGGDLAGYPAPNNTNLTFAK